MEILPEVAFCQFNILYGTSATTTIGATSLGYIYGTSGPNGTGTYDFLGTFSKPSLTDGTTYYFWITANLAGSVTNNTSLFSSSITAANLSYIGLLVCQVVLLQATHRH